MENPIAILNDRFRKSGFGGQILLTPGITALPFAEQTAILNRVRTFDAFTADNDPHREHDFGSIDFDGAGRVFWKIDTYAPDMLHGSEDPADTSQTVRVLTIMLASEY